MSVRRYPVVIEPTTTGYSAIRPTFPDVPARAAPRKSLVEIFRMPWWCISMPCARIGAPIPEPYTSVDYVEVAA
jgi:hypothetical protein